METAQEIREIRDLKRSESFRSLRQRAEKLLHAMEYVGLPTERNQELAALYQDLMVFHIELELQQDELVSSRQETEALLRENFAAFELAPLYYWKVNEKGMVQQWNLLGAECFGKSRQHLLPGKVPLALIVDPESHNDLHAFLRRVFSRPQVCRITVKDRRGAELILLGRKLPNTDPALAMIAGVPPQVPDESGAG